ncbi:MAG: hypothetical protein JXK94_13770 [Deltaproteobacteria bacterium]|nr:hypothetical protein [Deltaproteobacteria bacterium]
MAMDEVGEEFRATKDLDIVLCVEVLDVAFVKAFWEFVKAGRYRNQQQSTGRKLFYRFFEPEDESFPYMLELFSRKPDALVYAGEGRLTPIPMGEEASSLSAILLDEGYYHFLHAGKRDSQGLPFVGPEYIIPLKARAWLDLKKRREQGQHVDRNDIKKHKNDVFRLFRIISPENIVELPEQVAADLNAFIQAIADKPIELKNFGYKGAKLDDILTEMRDFYGLGHRQN